MFILQAAFGWLSPTEERGRLPEADSWFLLGEVQSSAGWSDWRLCLHSLSGQTGRPHFHTQVLSKENLLQRPLALGTPHWKPYILPHVPPVVLHASAAHLDRVKNMLLVCNLRIIFSVAHMDSECMMANVLFLGWHCSYRENHFSVCVFWLRKLERFVFYRLITLQTASLLEWVSTTPLCLFRSVRPSPSEEGGCRGAGHWLVTGANRYFGTFYGK